MKAWIPNQEITLSLLNVVKFSSIMPNPVKTRSRWASPMIRRQNCCKCMGNRYHSESYELSPKLWNWSVVSAPMWQYRNTVPVLRTSVLVLKNTNTRRMLSDFITWKMSSKWVHATSGEAGCNSLFPIRSSMWPWIECQRPVGRKPCRSLFVETIRRDCDQNRFESIRFWNSNWVRDTYALASLCIPIDSTSILFNFKSSFLPITWLPSTISPISSILAAKYWWQALKYNPMPTKSDAIVILMIVYTPPHINCIVSTTVYPTGVPWSNGVLKTWGEIELVQPRMSDWCYPLTWLAKAWAWAGSVCWRDHHGSIRRWFQWPRRRCSCPRKCPKWQLMPIWWSCDCFGRRVWSAQPLG